MFENENMGGGAFMWFLIILLLFNGGGFAGNNANWGNVVGEKCATTQDVYWGNHQTMIANKLNDIQGAITTAQYENAAIDNCNANGINMRLNDGFAGLSRQMSECCCEIKTQLLQDKYDDVRNQLAQAQGIIANTAQSQYILGQLGRYYAYPPLAPYLGYTNGFANGYSGTTIA